MPYNILNFRQSPYTISDATTSASGTMSAADKAKLDGIPAGGGGVSFQRVIAQPADGSSFIVVLPASAVQPDGNYAVQAMIASGTLFTGIIVVFSSQTANQFQVVTQADLPNGTLINFTVGHL